MFTNKLIILLMSSDLVTSIGDLTCLFLNLKLIKLTVTLNQFLSLINDDIGLFFRLKLIKLNGFLNKFILFLSMVGLILIFPPNRVESP